MEIVGGLILSLVALLLLAGLGLVTIVALGLMVILGLLTQMSFRRLFFVSFGLGLLAPVALAVAGSIAIEDGSLERDLRDEIGEIMQLPEDRGGNWSETLSELQDLRRDIEEGELSDEEIEARVEELFGGDNGLPLKIEAKNGEIEVEGEGDESTSVVTIDID